MRAIILLVISNVFMTFAWYGHLKWFPGTKEVEPLWKIILLSWGIALFEYCFQVPGNRIGLNVEGFSVGQLKVMQEVITLAVFVGFSWLFLQQKLTWNYYVAFALMVAAAAFVFVIKPGSGNPNESAVVTQNDVQSATPAPPAPTPVASERRPGS